MPEPAPRLDDGPVVTDGATVPGAGERLPSTRASRAWVKVLPAIVLLVVILVFVLQNMRRAKVSFLGFSGTLPLAVSLLAAAALGGLFVLTLGSVRILQLRRVIRHDRRTSAAVDTGRLHEPKRA